MYKVILCPNCGNVFMSEARRTVRCPYCKKHFYIKRLIRDGYLLKKSYSWDEAHNYLLSVTSRKKG